MARRRVARALANILPLALLVGCQGGIGDNPGSGGGTGPGSSSGGAGGGGGGAGIATTGFAPLACNGLDPLLLPGLAFADPPDYVELWKLDVWSEKLRELRGSRGTRCSAATDVAACEAAFTAAAPAMGFRFGECVQICPEFYLLVNRGDEVLVVNDDDGLAELLGAIDAPEDAVAVALNAGYRVACDDIEQGAVKKTGAGYEVIATRLTDQCPVEQSQYLLAVDAGGKLDVLASRVQSTEATCIGRRPAGLVTRRGRGATRLGAYLAEVAALEAASVRAFATLRDELRAHGAPAALIARADEARRDEIRHARVMSALARRFGGQVVGPEIARRRLRSLEALAIDNAAEGCVRETFGALVGAYQAATAGDAGLRAAMAPIARDEMRHGELSWAIDAWARRRLSRRARAEARAARREALAGVLRDAGRAPDASYAAAAGLPGVEAKRTMSEAFAGLVEEWDAGRSAS